MRQILAVERADRLVAPQRQPGHFEDADRHERRQFGDRVEKQIEEIDRQREAPVVEVRVEPDDGFRHELRREKDDGRRYERLDQVRSSVAGRNAGGMQSGLDQHAHLERVDDQRDIVAYQDRRDILRTAPRCNRTGGFACVRSPASACSTIERRSPCPRKKRTISARRRLLWRPKAWLSET